MNNTTIRIGLLALAGLLSGAAVAADVKTSPQHQLQPMLDEMLLAANAHDTDRFMAAYANTPTLVVTFDDMTMRGWQTVRDQQLEWWNDGKSDAVYTLRAAPQITPITADVVATTQSLEVTSSGPDGTPGTMRVVATSVWHKLPEGWRIVLAHESLID